MVYPASEDVRHVINALGDGSCGEGEAGASGKGIVCRRLAKKSTQQIARRLFGHFRNANL